MELDIARIREYKEFMEEHKAKIATVCMEMEEYIQIAMQCMDPEGGHGAGMLMMQNMENIRKNIPASDGISKRLELVLHHIDDARNTFGGR